MADKIVFPYTSSHGNDFFDSIEERWFAMWCEELVKHNYLAWWERGENWQLTPAVYTHYIKETQLKTKVKREQKTATILSESTYTADFKLCFKQPGLEKFVGILYDSNFDPKSVFISTSNIVHVEIKPIWDMQNMTRVFVSKQKFLYDRHKVLVNLIKTEQLFKSTFMPQEAMPDFKVKRPSPKQKKQGKQVGDWKIDYIPKTFEQFINAK